MFMLLFVVEVMCSGPKTFLANLFSEQICKRRLTFFLKVETDSHLQSKQHNFFDLSNQSDLLPVRTLWLIIPVVNRESLSLAHMYLVIGYLK